MQVQEGFLNWDPVSPLGRDATHMPVFIFLTTFSHVSFPRSQVKMLLRADCCSVADLAIADIYFSHALADMEFMNIHDS